MLEIHLLPHGEEGWIVEILLSPSHIPARRLNMTVGEQENPQIGPGRRDRQRCDLLSCDLLKCVAIVDPTTERLQLNPLPLLRRPMPGACAETC